LIFQYESNEKCNVAENQTTPYKTTNNTILWRMKTWGKNTFSNHQHNSLKLLLKLTD